MSTAKRTLRNWKSGAWGAAVAVLLGVFPPFSPWFANHSYDLPFLIRSDVKREDAVIIYMDDKSHTELNQNRSGLWDRSLHADLVHHLVNYGARGIVFDIWFDETNSSDGVFLDSIKSAKQAGIPVVVGATIIEEVETHGAVVMTNTQYKVPFEDLAAVAAWGWSERGPEGQILRRHFPGTNDQSGEFIPSVAWKTARLTSKETLPPAESPRWINYYGPSGNLDSCSYSRVISNALPATKFAGKVCFVGASPPQIAQTAGNLVVQDTWTTPYGKTPGVDIIATVYLNLIHSDWLKRMPLLSELILFVTVGASLGLGLSLIRPTLATGGGIAGMLFVSGVGCWLMVRHQIWFSWLIVVALQIPAAIVSSILTNTKRLAQEKVALQTQLVAAQTAMQELATASAEGMATRVEGETWSERADTAAEKALAVISGTAPDGQPVIPDHDLVRRVGKGAYGEVWLARNVIGTFHAVKIVKREDFESDEPFDREFRGIQKFMPISRSHPGLVQILHAGRNQQLGYMYYIMEVGDDEKTGQEIYPDTYVPKNLAKEIKKRRHFPASECLQLSLQLTAALDYLHQQNLIHRDIKPANIIFVRGAPKFADIGLVTDIAPTGREATFLGTVGYIPPEGPGTPASDVFSLGKVLYEASMGLGVQQYPELPSTMIERPDLQVFFQLNQIILKACQEDRIQRYQSAAEMHSELLKLQTTLGPERKT